MKQRERAASRNALLVVFCVMAGGITFAGMMYFVAQKENLREAKFHELAAIAELKVREISSWRDQQINNALVPVRNTFTARAVRDWLADPADAELQFQLELWMERFREINGYRNVILLDPQGSVRLSVPGGASIDSSLLEQILQAPVGSRPIFTDFYLAEPEGQIYLSLFTQVPDPDRPAGPHVGFFALMIDPAQYLYPYIQLWPTPSPSAETLLVKLEEGEILYLNELRHRHGAALTLRRSAADVKLPAALAVKGEAGTTAGYDYRGEPVLTAFRSIPDSPSWALVAKVDRKEVFRPLWEPAVLVGVLVAALIMAAGAMLMFLGRRQSVRVLEEQTAALEERDRARAELLEFERRAREELRQSEERLRMSNDAAAIGTWRWEPQMDTYEWDDRSRALLGLPAEEKVSFARFLALLHPEDRVPVAAALKKSVAAVEPYQDEYRVVLPDGSTRWLLARGQVRTYEGEKPQRMLGIIMDITERKRYERELGRAREAAEAAARTKAEFMANMSHEIRTPMNGILGVTELLLDTETSVLQREYLDMVKASAMALLTLVNDVLDFSKIEAGAMQLEQVVFDLWKMVEKVTESLAVRAFQKGLALTVAIDPGLPECFLGDPARLRQVLLNLVGNAVKFTDNGEVAVRVEGSPGVGGSWQLRFAVADTGIGIPQDKLGMLFQSFTQVDTSRSRSYEGTGLGLAISKRLVEQMGGEIRVESREGKGSTFSFEIELPAVDRPGAETVPSGADGPEPADVASVIPFCTRVLVAEDNPVNLTVVETVLLRAGARVTVARNGVEAIDAAARDRFHVILMDVQMPEMDGLEATRRIRATGAEVPIVGLTAHALAEDRERCLAAGMDDYLAKPVTALALREKVSYWAQRRPLPAADPDKLLSRLGGERSHFDVVVGTFRENAPGQFGDVQAAVAAADPARLQAAAHRLKGGLSVLGAEVAWCLAEQLEAAGEKGDLAKARLLIEQLGTEMVRVMEQLGPARGNG